MAKSTDRTARRSHATGCHLRGGGDLVLRRLLALLLVAFFAMSLKSHADVFRARPGSVQRSYSIAARLLITSAFSCSMRREMARSRRLANFFFKRATRAF